MTSPMSAMDFVGPAIAAVLFVVGMSFVREPQRRAFNAILVAGAAGLYISGGFGPLELLYAAVATPMAYRGLRSYHFIGIAWLMHAAWDLPHHLWDRPLWPYLPNSSLGCVVFDSLIAMWFLAGAPTLIRRAQVSQLEGTDSAQA